MTDVDIEFAPHLEALPELELELGWVTLEEFISVNELPAPIRSSGQREASSDPRERRRDVLRGRWRRQDDAHGRPRVSPRVRHTVASVSQFPWLPFV